MKLRKIWLKINGANRMAVVNPEKDSLADVLRRMGLTGTKIGCNAGQCGACSVILDGKLIRSCVRKIKNVPDYAEITTIEGIGTSQNLHPIQQAFITCGAVQCGFCSPGFIVSAYALLTLENPKPTRQEVRAWFQKNHNICRCTGYKHIINAVMLAAEVMRGEKTVDDLAFKMPEDGRIYSTRYPKPTAIEKVTGLCDYGDDLSLKMPPGTLELALVQPNTSHAKIVKIDTSAAEKMTGVVKVITAKDIKGTNRCSTFAKHKYAVCDGNFKPIICDEKIFQYGDVVAVVAATTRDIARAAAKEVVVELEELPAYMTALEALSPQAIRIHPETPNELFFSRVLKGNADIDEVFANSSYVVEGSFHSSREPHLPVEPDVLQAYFDEEDRITIQCKSQRLHAHQSQISDGIGMPVEKIRIIQNPTGGSFGYTMAEGPLALVAVCAIAVNGPVSLTLSYPEHQAYTGKRGPSYTNGMLACDKDGKIIGLKYDAAMEVGAYIQSAAALLERFGRFLGFPYNIPNVKGICRAVLSNTSFEVAYRAFGSPQAFTCSEALMDMMADKIGMDRFEFRYQNIARPGDSTVSSYPYFEYPMEKMMNIMRPHYEKALERAKSNSTETKKHGIGLVWGGYVTSKAKDKCEVELELNPDGSITHYNSWEQMGQGADTGTLIHTYEALRPLGISPDQIHLVQNDTAITPNTGPAAGSRSHYMVGRATIDAAEKLMKAMKKEDGEYRSYEEMVKDNIITRYKGISTHDLIPINQSNGVGEGFPTLHYILYLCEVEVDITTGKTKVLNFKGVSDIGVIGNLNSVEGQAYSGIAHGIGFALKEDYSDLKKHSTIAGAGIPTCEDIPDDIEMIFNTTPRKTGPYGSAGCAESFQSVSHMAVINAIENATGVRIHELPATPDKVKAALEAREAGKELKPEKYDFGSRSFEEINNIIDSES